MTEAEKRAWLARMFDEHGSAVERFLFRLTGNHADACELTQETYLRMWQLKNIEEILDPRAYMFTIGANLAKQHLSRQGRSRGSLDASDPAVQEDLSHHPDFANEIADAETKERIRKAFDELPPKVRAAWHLKHGHGLTYEEIATHLGVGKDAVKKYLQQVIRHLQERLGPKDDE